MGDGVGASLQPQVREPGVPGGWREGRGLAEAASRPTCRPQTGWAGQVAAPAEAWRQA